MEALDSHRQHQDTEGEARSLLTLAAVALRDGRPEDAWAPALEATERLSRLGYEQVADAWDLRGYIELALDRPAAALEAFRSALVRWRAGSNAPGIAKALAGIACAATALGDHEVAIRLFGASATGRPLPDRAQPFLASAGAAVGEALQVALISAGGRLGTDGAMRLAMEQVATGLAEEVRAQVEEARVLRRRIAAAADAERRRLERNLHDGAQQRLLTLQLQLRLLRRSLPADAPPAVTTIAEQAQEEAGAALERPHLGALQAGAVGVRGRGAHGPTGQRARGGPQPPGAAKPSVVRAAPSWSTSVSIGSPATPVSSTRNQCSNHRSSWRNQSTTSSWVVAV